MVNNHKKKNPNAVALGRLGGLAGAKRKLTSEDVRAIRKSEETYKVLAERYNVSEVTIHNIKNRRTWKWLDPEEK